MNSFEKEIKDRRIQEILQVRASYVTEDDIQKAEDTQNALNVVEKSVEEGIISRDILLKIKNSL